jgi:hypothetical protein
MLFTGDTASLSPALEVVLFVEDNSLSILDQQVRPRLAFASQWRQTEVPNDSFSRFLLEFQA